MLNKSFRFIDPKIGGLLQILRLYLQTHQVKQMLLGFSAFLIFSIYQTLSKFPQESFLKPLITFFFCTVIFLFAYIAAIAIHYLKYRDRELRLEEILEVVKKSQKKIVSRQSPNILIIKTRKKMFRLICLDPSFLDEIEGSIHIL